MRSPNIKFWIGMCAVTLGTISLIVERYVFGTDYLAGATTPHTLLLPAGIALILGGYTVLLWSYFGDD